MPPPLLQASFQSGLENLHTRQGPIPALNHAVKRAGKQAATERTYHLLFGLRAAHLQAQCANLQFKQVFKLWPLSFLRTDRTPGRTANAIGEALHGWAALCNNKAAGARSAARPPAAANPGSGV